MAFDPVLYKTTTRQQWEDGAEAWEGGRLAAMAFSTAGRNEFFSIPVSIIRDRAQLAPPGAWPARPVQPQRTRGLGGRGFCEVSVQTVPAR